MTFFTSIFEVRIPKATPDRAKVVIARPIVDGVSAPTTTPSYLGSGIGGSPPDPVQVTVVVPSPASELPALQPAGALSFRTPIRLSGLSEVQVKFSP
jgi:hypothetical protein